MARVLKYSATFALLCFATAACFAQATLRNRITQEIDSNQMTRLQGNINPRIYGGVDQGRLNAASRIRGVSLLFGPSAAQKAELQALIAQQHDPASPLYHKWITPDQYADRFSLSPADVAKISDWLKSQGFKVDSVSRSRNRIAFSGTVGQVESVFQTEFHRYLVDGEVHFANATELSVPSAFAKGMLGFRGVDDFRLKPRAKVTSKFTAGNGLTALMPADFATIYHVGDLYNIGFDGTGQRIAVVGQTAIDLNDINTFRSLAGLSSNPPQLLLIPGATSVTLSGDEVEADLDLEWSGSVAKNATIIYVYADTSNASDGVIGAFAYAINQNVAPIISISYGGCELQAGIVSFFQAAATQADSQGQTIVSATGDNGAADCEIPHATIATHGLSVDTPAVIPEVTGVGGTEFTGDSNHNPTYWNAANDPTTRGSAVQYIPETAWNDSDATGLAAGGGGVSTVVGKPSFQTALTPADGHRDVPDIALNASPNHDPYLICNAGSCGAPNNAFVGIGGTSAGAPTFSGILAIINQATESSAGQGSVNPTLYSLAGVPATYASAFHDITTGNNKVTCQGGSTGCTSANSHAVVAQAKSRSKFASYAGFLLLPLCAVLISVKRRRSVALIGVLVAVAALSVQVACGGGSGPPPPPPPPPNLQIGWSAGAGYDVVTGLGSVQSANLAAAWPGYTLTPGFSLTGPPSIIATHGAPSASTITITPTGFSGIVNLTCSIAPPATATCSLQPTQRTLSGAPTNTQLTINATTAGSYTVSVTGSDTPGGGGKSHSVNIPVTMN